MYNINFVVFGMVFFWFGWVGFNGGFVLGGNLWVVLVWIVIYVLVCVGGVIGMFWIWLMKGVLEIDVELEGGDFWDEVVRNCVMVR